MFKRKSPLFAFLKFTVVFLISLAIPLPLNAQLIISSGIYGNTISKAFSSVIIPESLPINESIVGNVLGSLAFSSFASLAPALKGSITTRSDFGTVTIRGNDIFELNERLNLGFEIENSSEGELLLQASYSSTVMISENVESMIALAKSGFEKDGYPSAVVDYAVCLNLMLNSFPKVVLAELRNYFGEPPVAVAERLMDAHILFIRGFEKITKEFSAPYERTTNIDMKTFDKSILNEMFRIAASDPYALNLITYHSQFLNVSTMLTLIETLYLKLLTRVEPEYGLIRLFYTHLTLARENLGIITKGDRKRSIAALSKTSVKEFLGSLDYAQRIGEMREIEFLEFNLDDISGY